jgi:hypothetical protein
MKALLRTGVAAPVGIRERIFYTTMNNGNCPSACDKTFVLMKQQAGSAHVIDLSPWFSVAQW